MGRFLFLSIVKMTIFIINYSEYMSKSIDTTYKDLKGLLK